MYASGTRGTNTDYIFPTTYTGFANNSLTAPDADHALFAGDALAVIKAAGVGEVWSTDCIAHPSNAIAMAPLLAAALQPLLSA